MGLVFLTGGLYNDIPLYSEEAEGTIAPELIMQDPPKFCVWSSPDFRWILYKNVKIPAKIFFAPRQSRPIMIVTQYFMMSSCLEITESIHLL